MTYLHIIGILRHLSGIPAQAANRRRAAAKSMTAPLCCMRASVWSATLAERLIVLDLLDLPGGRLGADLAGDGGGLRFLLGRRGRLGRLHRGLDNHLEDGGVSHRGRRRAGDQRLCSNSYLPNR